MTGIDLIARNVYAFYHHQSIQYPNWLSYRTIVINEVSWGCFNTFVNTTSKASPAAIDIFIKIRIVILKFRELIYG